ncbi:MAG: AAA family ATPase [Tannerella sp.]|nr:AAA family ATPase [Tannerella sp.]
MGIKINTTELHKILEITPAGHNIMLVGKHGIGKSKIIEDYFTGQSKRIVTLFLGQMSDPGDIIGLPVLDTVANKTDFRPPYWFPEDGTPIVLFLDELNRARPEILQTVMDLTLNRTLAGKRLPEGSQIISAVNEGEEYQLTDLDPALLSRFNVYYFSPTPNEWLLWAAENRLDSRIIDFIEKNPDCLDSPASEDTGMEKTADRRSWHRVSELLAPVEKVNKTIEKMIAGVVGVSAALKFANYLTTHYSIDAKKILTDFEKHRQTVETMPAHELAVLNDGMFRIVETEDKQDKVRKYVKNIEAYIKWLRENKRNEAIAHWTTLFDSETYPKTKIAVLTYSPYIFQNIMDFIKHINL